MHTLSVRTRTGWLATLAAAIVLATSAAAQAQEKKDKQTEAASVATTEGVGQPAVGAPEPGAGPAGQEWWRDGFEPFAGVLLPPPDDGSGPAPDDRATNCCPMGGWVQSLGFNPVWQGNVFSLTQPLILKEIQIEASFNGALEITFGIYRQTALNQVGNYTSLRIKKVNFTGPTAGHGRDFYSSGPLNGTSGIVLQPFEDNGQVVSTFFAVAAGWGQASIDFRIDQQDYSGGINFCNDQGRVRGSWGQLQTNPPGPGGQGSHQINNLQFFPTGAVSMRMCFEVPGGACCLGDRSCVDDVTANVCVNELEGQYLGLFTICALNGDDCDGFGACCPDGPGPCTIKTAAECAAFPVNGVYKGDGTACDAIDPCDPVVGACCSYNSDCVVSNEYDCEVDPRRDTPGVYQGDTAECQLPNGSDRCKPLGACCSVTNPNTCTDVATDGCVLYDCVNALNTTGMPHVCPAGYVPDSPPNRFCPQAGDQCYKVVRTWSEGEPCAHGACFDDVGACCLLSECMVTNELECGSLGGEFTGAGTSGWEACEAQAPDYCESSPNANEGACCLPNGNCKLLSAASCINSSGVFQEEGIACSAFICAEGACCYQNPPGTALCAEMRPLDCAEDFDGQFRGAGTSCPANPVDCFPTGACCLPDGSCEQTFEQNCLADGGDYNGDDSSCEAADCPIPGACCINVGVYFCFEENDEQCAARPQPSKVFTPFASCANGCANGSCCQLDASCSVISGPECSTMPDTLFTTGGTCTPTPCVVRGACCNAGGCEATTEDLCSNGGGVYRGDEVSCSTENICDEAACCTGATCSNGFITDCIASGGLAGEPNEFCQPNICATGACCIDFNGDGNLFCQNGLTLFQCRNLEVPFSQFGGPASTCSPNFCTTLPSACCKSDGSCEELTQTACNAISGATFQLGETCASAACQDETNACCKPDNTCEDLTQAACDALPNTTYLPGQKCAGANCPEFPFACCEQNGDCTEINSNACAVAGGIFQNGDTCATAGCVDQCGAGINSDFDSNGKVDLKDFAALQLCAGDPSGLPTAQCLCAFDADGDGDIDAADVADFVDMLACADYQGFIPGDYDGLGAVDLEDFAAFQRCATADGNDRCLCIFNTNANAIIDSEDLSVWLALFESP